MTINDIRSIGWLNCADGSINLTPVFTGDSFPKIVNITREKFENIRGDEAKMKKTALNSLGYFPVNDY